MKSKRGFFTSIGLWVFIFTITDFLFIFNIHFTPQGNVGSLNIINAFASLIYLIIWLFISLWAGLKNQKAVLIAAIIYSLYPMLLILFPVLLQFKTELLFIKSKLLFILLFLGFYWSCPIQGFLFFYDDITTIYVIAIIQPAIFSIGYTCSRLYTKKVLQNWSIQRQPRLFYP